MAQSSRYRGAREQHRLAAWESPVTLRLAEAPDGAALHRLAQRDCRLLPPGPHLLAEREGRIEAAVSLASGELIADPFRRTAELCELLHCHAGDLRVAPKTSPTARVTPRPKLVTA